MAATGFERGKGGGFWQRALAGLSGVFGREHSKKGRQEEGGEPLLIQPAPVEAERRRTKSGRRKKRDSPQTIQGQR